MKSPGVIACIDCKYYINTWAMRFHGTYARCRVNHVPEIDLVTGKAKLVDIHTLPWCSTQRIGRSYTDDDNDDHQKQLCYY